MGEGLPRRPRVADGAEVVTGPGDAVQIRGVTPPLRLTGGLARALLPRLDGRQTVEELVQALSGWPAESVTAALQALAGRGLLTDGPGPGREAGAAEQAQAAFYWSLTTGPVERGEAALAALGRARILLYGWGPVQAQLAALLQAAGAVGLTQPPWHPAEWLQPDPSGLPGPAELVLLALPRPAPGATAGLHRACLEARVPFLPVVLAGGTAVVGPGVIPGRSPCYGCYQERLRSNQDYPEDEAAYAAHLDQVPPPPVLPEWPPFTGQVAAWAAMEVVRLVTGVLPPVTLGQVCFFDAATGRQRLARLWKWPRCPACSQFMGGSGSVGGFRDPEAGWDPAAAGDPEPGRGLEGAGDPGGGRW